MIFGFVPDDENTPKLLLFAETISAQESAFFGKLSSAPLAWNQVQEYTYQFYREMNNLESKWHTIENNDKSGDEKIKKISKEIRSLFEKIVKEVIDE